jgi:transposase
MTPANPRRVIFSTPFRVPRRETATGLGSPSDAGNPRNVNDSDRTAARREALGIALGAFVAGAIGALVYNRRHRKARLLISYRPGTIENPNIIHFLQHLRRHIRGRILLFGDGSGIHRSATTKQWVEGNYRWLAVFRLPAYAPELNPVEGLWSSLKTKDLAHVNDGDLTTLHGRARRGRKRLRRPFPADFAPGYLARNYLARNS